MNSGLSALSCRIFMEIYFIPNEWLKIRFLKEREEKNANRRLIAIKRILEI